MNSILEDLLEMPGWVLGIAFIAMASVFITIVVEGMFPILFAFCFASYVIGKAIHWLIRWRIGQ